MDREKKVNLMYSNPLEPTKKGAKEEEVLSKAGSRIGSKAVS